MATSQAPTSTDAPRRPTPRDVPRRSEPVVRPVPEFPEEVPETRETTSGTGTGGAPS